MKTDRKKIYIAIVGLLSTSQRRLFEAISQEPTAHLFGKAYMTRHGLTRGGADHALCTLLKFSLVSLEEGEWRIQPQEMRIWLEAVHENGLDAAELLQLVNLQPTRMRD